MSIRALLVGLAVFCSPIGAQINFNECGVSQGCFIQPPNCNDGNDFANCAVAASFKKIDETWLEIELVTSLVHPVAGTQIGNETGVYAALGLSTDQSMVNYFQAFNELSLRLGWALKFLPMGSTVELCIV